jgi:hypothetical protein
MLTELNIINAMLGSIGESKVTSPNSQHPSAIQAKAKLEELNPLFQMRDWWFNHEYNLILAPSPVSGEVIVPSNTLSAGSVVGYVWRGNRLYDPYGHTFNIGKSVTVDLVVQLPIEELPMSAAQYLKAHCVRQFHTDEEGDQIKINEYTKAEEKAEFLLKNEHLRMLKVNKFNSPSVAAMMYRIQPSSARVGLDNPNWPGGRSLT